MCQSSQRGSACEVCGSSLSQKWYTLLVFPLQVGFGSGFKCNSAVWRALRTIHSPHACWQHLPSNGSQQQDSQLRVENNTAEQPKAAKAETEPLNSSSTNGYSQGDPQHHPVMAKSMADAAHADHGPDATAQSKPNGLLANGESHGLDGKMPRARQLIEDQSGSGEIKAHNEPVSGMHAMAVL